MEDYLLPHHGQLQASSNKKQFIQLSVRIINTENGGHFDFKLFFYENWRLQLATIINPFY
jgi:hypothetical protein